MAALTTMSAGLLAAPSDAAAQDLAARIAEVTGPVAFDVEVRDGVEVCENGLRRAGQRWMWRHGSRSGTCGPGPLRILVDRRDDGQVRELDVGRPEDLDGASVVQLGIAGPDEAEAYLLGLARTRADEDAAGTGMMVVGLMRGVDPAPELLDLARDQTVRRDNRRSALFWVSQIAAERIGPHLAGIAADEAEDQEVRDAAVFALSQRPDDEAVPVLMELARTAPHGETRRSALFWLAQADDPRVPDFFAELILRGGG
jgi:hypothetical protein